MKVSLGLREEACDNPTPDGVKTKEAGNSNPPKVSSLACVSADLIERKQVRETGSWRLLLQRELDETDSVTRFATRMTTSQDFRESEVAHRRRQESRTASTISTSCAYTSA